MTHEKTILLTGVTGLLGSEILSSLLKCKPQPRVLVLVRGDPDTARRKFQAIVDDPLCRELSGKVELVLGDLQRPALGLEPRTRSAIREQITHVIHAAASIDFDLPYAEAHAINYDGTVRIYELAAEARNLKAFAHVSTAYVAGRRTGVIAEQELEHEAGFVNNYERTKYEGELFLKSRMASLPIAIYRTTTMIGNSITGVVRQFNYFHAALRSMYLGRVPFIPGDPRYRIDVIPHDWAAEVIRFMAMENFQPGETYHVCSGSEHSLSLLELIEATCAVFSKALGSKCHAPIPPAIISLDEFRALVEGRQGQNREGAKQIQLPKTFGYFIAELALPKLFDSAHLKRDFHLRADRVPDIHTYYSKVIEFCLQKQWGRGNRGMALDDAVRQV